MDNKRSLATTALALSVAVAFAPFATAQQQEPKLQMSPGTVSPGRSVVASTGPCETYSAVTSPGLKAPITLSDMPGDPGKLHGVGDTITEAGTYTATVQCDGKTLTTTFTVGPIEIGWSLGPAEVEPGGTVYAQSNLYSDGGCFPAGPLTSPGFAAPMEIRGGNMGRLTGSTTVITTPGVYEVVWQCADRPDRSVKTFRILGTPPTSTTPPPPGNPKPKAPIVKPKGAPQTGGGGTAGGGR